MEEEEVVSAVIRSFEELSRRISSSVSDVLLRVSYLR